MRATEKLHELGQSLWLDNITRELLDSGQLATYIDDYSVTGLTSNPSIFDKAIASGGYDDAIHEKAQVGVEREALFFDLAIEDLRRASDMFGPVHERTDGVDGWVSLEVSPLLAYDTQSTVAAATSLHAQAERDNLFIKIPGTAEGLPAIEEAIAAGVPVNVTLLFSPEHYRAAADAFMRGVERRIAAGLNPVVGSVASVFMSRWDAAVLEQVPHELDRHPGARRRPEDVPGLSRGHGLGPLAAPEERRRAHAAPALGIDEHEGPERTRRPLPLLPRRAVHDQHDSRGDTPGVLRPRPRGRRRCRPTAGTQTRRSRLTRPQGSTSTRSRRSSRPTQPRASSTRGTTSCPSSTSSRRHSRHDLPARTPCLGRTGAATTRRSATSTSVICSRRMRSAASG